MRANWFVGLPVAADGWLEPLMAAAPASLRRVHPADLHVTVAFFGEAGEEAALAAWHVAEGFEHAPVTVRLSGLAPMGNPRRPTALSVLFSDGADAASQLIVALQRPMERAATGREEPPRPPKPHITVARPARNASASARRQAFAWAENVPPIERVMTLRELALYTALVERGPHGPGPLRKFRIVRHRVFSGDG